MAVSNRVKTTLPAIPKVTVSDRNLQRFCDSVTQYCAIHGGNVGSGLDRAITAREMVNLGFASWKQTRPNKPGGSGGGTLVPVPPEIPDIIDPPTKPKKFKVLSGTIAILLVWDDVDFRGAGSTEIWRNTKPEFSTAAKVVTTPAAVYSDIPDGDDLYYYWIRHTNTLGDKGPISDMESGQAGLLTSNPDGDTMLVSDLVAYAIYATELTAVHVRGGDMDFAGGRFTVDVNGNCTASSLTINAGGYARSSNYAMDAAGWAIFGDGSVEFNDGKFRGDVHATNFYGENGIFKGTIYADKIIGDLVSATAFPITQGRVYAQNWTKVGGFHVKNNNKEAATLMVQSATFDCEAGVDGGSGGFDGEVYWHARLLYGGKVVAQSQVSSGFVHVPDGGHTIVRATLFTPAYFDVLPVNEFREYELQVRGEVLSAQSTGCGAMLFRNGSAFEETKKN